MLPWGTPTGTDLAEEIASFTFVTCVLSDKYDLNQVTAAPEKPALANFEYKMGWLQRQRPLTGPERLHQ